jgi:ferric-dicitrate binding protein FerR (iron transport regulator)
VAECATVEEALLARARGATLGPEIGEHLRTCASCAAANARIDALDDALGALADEVAAPPPFETVLGPARVAARSQRQLRWVRRALPLTLAVAGAVAVTVGASQFFHRAEVRVAVAGDVLDASRGVSEAALADGARVMVAAGRAVVEASDRSRAVVRLETGNAFVNVPRLGAGRSFVVVTDELEARVHGTRFEVVRGGQGTRVTVAEGSVEIRPRDQPAAAFLLGKGESRLVEGPAQRRSQARAAARASLDRRDDSAAEDQIRAWLATDPPAEEAAEAYALLGWKMSRDGNRAGAAQSYRRALELLPADRAPLWADNACARLALIEESEGASARAAAWRRYLERFPAGAHASTARSRVVGSGDARKVRR